MCARNSRIVSSWKLESSSTFHPSSRDVATISQTAVPILPPTCEGTPASRRMWPIKLVVVVLPFDPVTPIVRPFRNGAASSTSPITAAPRARAASSGGRSAGTSGESTMRSAPSNTSGACRANGTRSRSSSAPASGSSSSGFRSVARTAAPCSARSFTAAIPDFLSPTTRAWRLANSMALPQLQRGQREEREHQARDPETRDNFRFRPAQRLEVVVQRGHFEDALAAAELVAADLQDDGERLQNEDAADENQQHLLLDQDRHHRHRSAEPERTYVAHENLRGMRVVPEKPERGAGHRAAKDRQLARVRIARQLEIVGQFHVAAGIGQDRQRARRHYHQPDRQAVQAIRQVDRVRHEDDHQ